MPLPESNKLAVVGLADTVELPESRALAVPLLDSDKLAVFEPLEPSVRLVVGVADTGAPLPVSDLLLLPLGVPVGVRLEVGDSLSELLRVGEELAVTLALGVTAPGCKEPGVTVLLLLPNSGVVGAREDVIVADGVALPLRVQLPLAEALAPGERVGVGLGVALGVRVGVWEVLQVRLELELGLVVLPSVAAPEPLREEPSDC